MIPALGVMIGFYIITRMLEASSRTNKKHIIVFTYITILVAVLGMIDILNAGSRVPSGL